MKSLYAVGFCFGGAISYLQAASGLGYAGVIGFYGWPLGLKRWPDRPKPIDAVDRYKCPVLSIFGGADEGIPQADVDQFEAACKRAGVRHDSTVYPGAPHSFFDRKYDEFKEASADAWRRVQQFVGGRQSGVESHAEGVAAALRCLPDSGLRRQPARPAGCARRRSVELQAAPSGTSRAELDAHPRLRARHLRHRVLPRALARAAHDQEVAPAEIERTRSPAAGRPQQEAARRPERDDGHDGMPRLPPDAVAMKRHAVAPVPVGGERDLAQGSAVTGGERRRPSPARRDARARRPAAWPRGAGRRPSRSYISRRSARHRVVVHNASKSASCPCTQAGRWSTQAPRPSAILRNPENVESKPTTP